MLTAKPLKSSALTGRLRLRILSAMERSSLASSTESMSMLTLEGETTSVGGGADGGRGV